jgi:hypothetical protein
LRESNFIASSKAQEDILYKFDSIRPMTGASEKLKVMHLNSTQEPLNESQRVSAAGTKIEEVVYKRPQTTQ